MIPLLLMRYPVRCLSCSKRQAVTLVVARRSVPSTVKQVRASRHDEGWSGWNATEEPGHVNAPTTVGSKSFTALQMRAPLAMPELRGVKLKHVPGTHGSEQA